MKKMHYFILGLLTLCVFSSGCARVQKVTVIEAPLEVPYESLGTIEIKTKAGRVSLSSAAWSSVEVLTLSLANTPTRANLYRKKLNSLLAEKASEKYDADAVINPEYWPPLEASSFPDGLIYARGEMIRYRRFDAE